MTNSRKKLKTQSKSKTKAPAKAAKRSTKLASKRNSPRPHDFIVKKNGELETKEERDKRLAELEALTIRCFRMAYDNYHNQKRH